MGKTQNSQLLCGRKLTFSIQVTLEVIEIMIIHYDHMSSKTHIHRLLLSNPVPMAKGLCHRKKVKAKQDTPSDPIHQAKSLHCTRIARRKRLRAVVVALVWNLLLPLT